MELAASLLLKCTKSCYVLDCLGKILLFEQILLRVVDPFFGRISSSREANRKSDLLLIVIMTREMAGKYGNMYTHFP